MVKSVQRKVEVQCSQQREESTYSLLCLPIGYQGRHRDSGHTGNTRRFQTMGTAMKWYVGCLYMARHDLREKYDAYATVDVPEYRVVNPDARTAELLMLKDGTYN